MSEDTYRIPGLVKYQGDPKRCAIWWTSQADYELLAEWYEILELPAYIESEFRSRIGRPGRGRLWINEHQQFPFGEIEWPEEKPAAQMAMKCAGIVMWAAHVPDIISLPGFVTDLALEFWRIDDREGAS